MGYTSAKMKARFVLLTLLLGSTLGAFNTSYRGGFFAYGDPSNYESVDGGATHELAGGMLVLCQYSLEYTRSVLSGLVDEDGLDLTAAWELLEKAEEQYLVAQIQMFEYQDYHASIQHSRRALELCEDAVELVSNEAGNGDVLGGGASDYELAWGAIERTRTLLNNLEDALSKLNDLDVSLIASVLDDARDFIDLAELQLNTGELGAAEASVSEAMSLLGQAMDLLQDVSQDKKIDKVLTLIESYEEQLRELDNKVVNAIPVTEDSEESLDYVFSVFREARDEIQQIKNQLEGSDLNLVVNELGEIYDDVLESLSSIGWLNDSDAQPLKNKNKPGETEDPLEDSTEHLNDEGPDASEPEEKLKDEDKTNNGKSPDKEEPVVEEEPEPEVEPEPEEAPKDEEKSNNGNPQNNKEPEPENDDDKHSSVIDKLVEKIKKWYERKKDKKDKNDKDD